MVQPDYISTVPANKEKLKCLQLPYSLSTMYPAMARAVARAAPDSTAAEIGWSALGLATSEVIMPATDFVMSTAISSKCNVVVTTLMSWCVAHVVCQKLKLPLVMISFQPDTTSAYFPHLNLEPKKAAEKMFRLQSGDIPEPCEENIESCKTLHRLHFTQYADALNEMCAKFDLSKVSFEDCFDVFSGTAPNLTTLNAVQVGLAPPPPDATPNTHTIGSLAVDYFPEDCDPEKSLPELCAFLKGGVPPVLISYGSVRGEDNAASITRAVICGLRDAGVQRAVILPGAAGIGMHNLTESDSEDLQLIEWCKNHVFIEEGRVQYAWLLPQCEMFFTHGGAGSTSAGLHAGIPLVITPVVFDQLFFAEIVRLMGVGTVVGTEGLSSITAERVAKGIREVRSPSVIEKVQAFSKKDKQGERAVDRAVRIIGEIAMAY